MALNHFKTISQRGQIYYETQPMTNTFMFPRRKAILLEYRSSNFSTYTYRSAQKHVKILQNLPKHDLTTMFPLRLQNAYKPLPKCFLQLKTLNTSLKILQQAFTCSEEQYKACLYVQLQQFQIGFQKRAHSCKQGPQQILLLLAVQPQSSLSWKTGNLKTPDQYIG